MKPQLRPWASSEIPGETDPNLTGLLAPDPAGKGGLGKCQKLPYTEVCSSPHPPVATPVSPGPTKGEGPNGQIQAGREGNDYRHSQIWLGLAPPNPEVDRTRSELRGKTPGLSPTC